LQIVVVDAEWLAIQIKIVAVMVVSAEVITQTVKKL